MKQLTATSLFVLLLVFSISAFSQARPEPSGGLEYENPGTLEYENPVIKKGYGSFGVGIGLPYGGIGGRIGYNASNRFNLFSGIGYNFLGLGFNLGMQYDFAVVNRTSFYVSGLGGYNAVTLIEGASEYNKVFYGPSLGIGLKLDTRKNIGNFWQFGLILPIRNAQYKDTVRAIKNDSRINSFTEPPPVLLTVGYNMGF